jgi:hypothetical protein
MMMRALLIVIGLVAASTAHAMKGDEFARLLDAWHRVNDNKSTTREDELGASMFTGYVRGVEDSMNGARFCITSSDPASLRIALITKYVKTHPEELHNGATTLIVQALQPAFPCTR